MTKHPVPLSSAYRLVNDELEVFPLNYSPTMYAAAGLNVSAAELSVWLEALLDGQILAPEHLREIWTPSVHKDGTAGDFGLGWAPEVKGDRWVVGHGGVGISFLGHYGHRSDERTVSVILLTNGARDWSTSPYELNRAIARMFAPEVVGPLADSGRQ